MWRPGQKPLCPRLNPALTNGWSAYIITTSTNVNRSLSTLQSIAYHTEITGTAYQQQEGPVYSQSNLDGTVCTYRRRRHPSKIPKKNRSTNLP
jgi:hypothetical protein